MTRIAWTSGTCSSAGEDIAYELAGDGSEVVVLGHGLGGNHAAWFQQVPVLARRFRVLTWDQRGFGRSSNRAGDAGPPAAVDDLHVLLDHLGIERAHLVGQSMGGWCVVGFALRSPDRVRSLVVADSTGGIVNDTIMQALISAERRELAEGVVGVHPAIGDGLPVDKAFLYQQIGGFRGDVADADMIAKLLSTRYPLEDVSALDVPALCIVGERDDLIPPAAVREVASVLRARCAEIANAGHSPYFEQPDAWNEAVLDFLTGV
jgi:pimeloyl-ACP methyl ester carboxylesterase